MQNVAVVVLGEAGDATRPGIRRTREMISGTDQPGSAIVSPAAPLHP
jgi:hypothetical protein